MTLFLIVALIVLSLILIKAADIVLIAVKRLSEQTKVGKFAISAIVLAIGTSFPELSVSITSAFSGVPSVSLGTVIGSNIANVSLVLGLAALSVGRVKIKGDFLDRDLWISLVAGLAPLILISDGALSRSDGIVLLAMYGAYAAGFFKGSYLEIGRGVEIDQHLYKFLRKIDQINLKSPASRNIFRLILGLSLLVGTSYGIVQIALMIAMQFNMPLFVVGLVMVAVGTSLPELAFSFRALKDRESGMFFGNILGSTIANSTLVIGLASIIHPIQSEAGNSYIYAAVFFVLVSLVLYYFAKTKKRIDWWEAGLLIVLYAIFVYLEVK